jgi:flagellar protein FliS
MTATPYEQPEWSAVDAADPLELVILLYEKSLRSVGEARRCLERGDIIGRVRALQSAVDCVLELVRSLNHPGQPELSRRLLELYVFVLDRMQEGNFRQQAEPLCQAENVLSTLLLGWRECQVRLQAEASATSAVLVA